MLLEVQAEAQLAAGRVEAGERTAREAIALAEASGRPEIQAFAYYALSFADATAMRMYEALDGGRKALLHARASADWYIRDTVATRLSFPLLATGELDDADELALDCVERATATHEHSNLSLGLATRAAAALLRGDLDAVDHLVQGSAEAGRRAHYAMTALFTPGTAFLGHLYRGELQQAEQVVEHWPTIPKSGRRGFRMMFDAVGAPPPSPLGHDLRPPSAPTQVAAGYFIAALDGALMGRRFVPPTDVRMVVERWHEGGLEYAASYPTSLSRTLRRVGCRQRGRGGGRRALLPRRRPVRGAGCPHRVGPGPGRLGPSRPRGRRRRVRSSQPVRGAGEGAGRPHRTRPRHPRPWDHRVSRAPRKRSVAGRAGHRHRRVNGHQQRAGRCGLPGSRPSPPHHRAPVAGAARRARVQRGR